MIRHVVAVIAGVALVAPTTTHAQSRWQREVSYQITRAAGFFGDRGFERTHDLYNGSLSNHEAETLELNLRAGMSYAVIGVCDEDCSDIDLRLFDSDGHELDSDVETDDKPIVQIEPRVSGRYTVKVIMASCSTSPCFYGVGVYGK